MPKFELTSSQREAVYTRDKAMLVSAAAGSGKTRVLTERLMARVAEGEDIDRFLVITFTRAAAAELRGRILTELNERAAANPSDKRLRRQTALLYRAHIGTIDSYCGALLRENAHLLGLSPSFTMLEQTRGEAMRRRALEDVLDAAYESQGEDEDFRRLTDSVGAGRDDSRLAERILSLHQQMQSRAFPERWAEEALAALELPEGTDAGETPWGAWLLADAAAEAEYRAGELERARQGMAGDEKLEKAYGDGFADAALLFRDLARSARDGQWDRAAGFAAGAYPALGRLMKYPDEARKARVKAVWDEARKARERLKKQLAGSSAALTAGVRASRGPLKALMGLVFALDAEFLARKRRADLCDFSDVEHFCVRLLANPDGTPTELARTLSGRFAEVMVDEYQDVNAVQELIFTSVSDGGRKLFAVGDVKQSVYRFRLADPGIFLKKYADFAQREDAARVLLRENFRSCAPVLDAANAVFGAILSPALGEIAYDDEARLVCGAQGYPEGLPRPELCVLDAADAGDDGELPDRREAEARWVARRIRQMVDGREEIGPQGDRRPVSYGDIAVLLRTPGTSGMAYRRALLEAGIPVNARQGGAFFEQPEIRFAVSLLAVADNPRQDVPLVAALRGLPFGFTPDELAALRAAAEGDLWTALCARAGDDARCAEFVSLVGQLREYARELPTDALLQRLYDRTGLLSICCAMPDGRGRTANLMLLYEYARKFESDGFRGLFRFVAWLRGLAERGEDPPAAAAGDAVQLMSVHRSKGLEFPVVFLADNSHRWNVSGSPSVLCHSAFGLGMRVTDAARGVDYPTLCWRAIAARSKAEELSEQMRVLYVAMTRAKERLILSCTVSKAEEKLAAFAAQTDYPISPRVLATADSPAVWLLRAASADPERRIELRSVSRTSAAARAEPETAETPAADPALTAALAEKLRWRYPYEAAVSLPSKLTATEAKGLEEQAAADPEAAALAERPRRYRRPDFGKKDRPLGGTERGIAAHLLMQHIDLAQTDSAAQVRAEIERLRLRGFLDERQAAAVEPEDILAFFRSPLGRRVRAAARVLREFRFSLLCPAETWFPDAPAGEKILLQGVVDLCIEEEGALTVIDFKTDAAVEPERYAGQLRAYAMAMGRITGLPVRGAELWYLRRKTQKTLALQELL